MAVRMGGGRYAGRYVYERIASAYGAFLYFLEYCIEKWYSRTCHDPLTFIESNKYFLFSMRRRFLLLAVITFLVAGMSIWRIWTSDSIVTPPGSVAGASVVSENFWSGSIPYLRLADEQEGAAGRLFFWDAVNGTQELSVAGGLLVYAAAGSADGRSLLVAAADGTQTALWLYQESEVPKFLAAVDGKVVRVDFAPGGRFASVLLLHSSASAPEVDLLDTTTERLSRVFPVALHAAWLTRTLGLVGVSPDGTLLYATLRSDGAADVVVLPVVAQSNVAVQPATDTLYFVSGTEERHVVAAYDLVRREQSVIAQLTESAEQYQLSLNAAGTDLAVRPEGAATPLSIVTLASGSVVALHVLSGPVVWVNGAQLLMEQSAAGITTLALFSEKEQKTHIVVAEGMNHLTL